MKLDLKIFKMGKKGVFWIWLQALVTIGIISIIYLIFNQILYSSQGIYPIVNTSMYSSNINTTAAITSMEKVKAIFDYWPVLLIIGVLIWAFARSQKEEYETGYRGGF